MKPIIRCTLGWLTAACMAMGASGCSKNNGLVPVTGKVTYQGQAVAGATVLFMGEGELRPATAITDANGMYDLRTLDASGAMPGTYTVVVTKTEAPSESGEPPSMEEAARRVKTPPPPPKRLLPAQYGDSTTSPLKYEVKAGQKNLFDIQLAP